MFQVLNEGVSKRSSKEVSREFKGSFKDILWKLQRCLKKVSSAFKEMQKKFQGCLDTFNEVLSLQFCWCWCTDH